MLEDPEAAPFEYAIRANEEELKELQEMFDELSSADEAAMLHFSGWSSKTDQQVNGSYDEQIRHIYGLLHRLGTDETKRYIEASDILG